MLFLLYIPLSFFLAVLQSIIPDLLFFGGLGFEISLVLLVYLGLNLDPVRGGLLSITLGFLVDDMSGAPTGLYMFLYVLLFGLTVLTARIFQSGKPVFIMACTLACALFESVLIIAFYAYIPGIRIGHLMHSMFVPQAVLLAVSAPIFFKCFRWLEGKAHAWDT
jgi:rod shape-determining protein MreD